MMTKKVGYDRAFMKGGIKEGNLHNMTHCYLEKIRAKEKNYRARRYFRRFQRIFRAVISGFCRMASPKVGAPN
jgi:hypothetical protein